MGMTSPGPPEPVRLELRGSVALILLDRPPVNAFNAQAQAALHRTADETADRDDIRAVVLVGARGVFSAGADIREMAAMSHTEMSSQAVRLQAAFNAVARIPKPVVAAIEGFALGGGCELALAADFRMSAASAILGLPEITLGVIPGAGGTQRLARLLGPSKAKDLIYTGRKLTGREAAGFGLVDRAVPTDTVLDAALASATRLANGPAAALSAAKTAIDVGSSSTLAVGLQLETSLFAGLFATPDRTLGMAAFLNRTEPRFTGT